MNFHLSMNHMAKGRNITSAIFLFWLAVIICTGTCAAQVRGHTEKNVAIDADTIVALRYIRAEVKLARDLYRSLSKTWGLEVFEKTAQSKQSLINAVSRLLEQYGIEDPSDDAGKSVYPDLQELYSYLIDRGNESSNNAVDVTVLIEQTVIADLNDALLRTDDKGIHKVLTFLVESSDNHLHALNRYLVMY